MNRNVATIRRVHFCDEHSRSPSPTVLSIEGVVGQMTSLVDRLNFIYRRIQVACSLLDRVRLKLEWKYVKDHQVEQLQQQVSSLIANFNSENAFYGHTEPVVHDTCDTYHRDRNNDPSIMLLNRELFTLVLERIEENYVRDSSESEHGLTSWLITRLDDTPETLSTMNRIL
jgi:hypothetical protein